MSTFSVGQSMLVEPEEGRSFYGESEVIPDGLSVSEAMRHTGMDYTVHSAPIFNEDGDRIKGYKRLFREDNADRTFGVVSDRYRIAQNVDTFAMCEPVMQQHGAVAEAGGIIDEGRKAWMLLRLPEPYKVAGEELLPWLLFVNGHDGAQGFGSLFIPYRPYCTNAIPWAFKTNNERNRKRGVKLIHTGDVARKLTQAEHIVAGAQAYFEQIATLGSRLARQRVSPRRLNSWLEKLYPSGTTDRQEDNAAERRETVARLVREAPNLEGYHMTAYAFVQATAEVADWGSSRQRDRMDRLAWNADTPLKNKALDIVLNSSN